MFLLLTLWGLDFPLVLTFPKVAQALHDFQFVGPDLAGVLSGLLRSPPGNVICPLLQKKNRLTRTLRSLQSEHRCLFYWGLAEIAGCKRVANQFVMGHTKMEECVEGIINTFHQYSVRVGHFDMLSMGELKQLIQKEFPNWLKDQKNPKAIEQLFQRLDKNKDKQVDFAEFMGFISEVAIATHENIHKEGHDGHAHHHH